ncbi:MAG: hypothetical protein D6E12_06970 [Desulfovibrio sp.]|nr:MAG: hypothetical protein D6E12_06970 [Desulfovibrio sp.]
MPYIPREKREKFDEHLAECAKELATQGELNYCIYKLSSLLIERLGQSYDTLSLCSSAMEHAKLEWYRRKLVPYEEVKIGENGDI